MKWLGKSRIFYERRKIIALTSGAMVSCLIGAEAYRMHLPDRRSSMADQNAQTLRLIFPQWQGGDNPPYYLGSKLLA